MSRKKLPWGLGARSDPPDSRDEEYAGVPIGLPLLAELPDVVDNRHLCPDHVFDQGEEPCCVGCAGASDMSSRFTELLGRPVLISARDAQDCALRHDQWPGEDTPGTSVRGLLRGLKAEGACPEDLWPLVEWGDDSNKHPCADAVAPFYRLPRYERVEFAQLDQVIFEQEYVLVTVEVHTGWINPTREHFIEYRRNFALRGLHAVRIMGYNRPERYYRVLNSWTDQWGENGCAKIGKEDLREHMSDLWVTILESNP